MKIASMKARCTAPEWQARIDLAACYRLVDLYGMSDMMANHISSHVPGEPGAFLINAYGMMYEEITASSLIKVDTSGNLLSKPDFGASPHGRSGGDGPPERRPGDAGLDYGINRAGYVIHGAIHRARHDVACVIHTHTWAGMALSALDCGVLPITQTAMRFLKIGYHEYQGVVLDAKEEASLLADLGGGEALILRNHGLLTVGKTIGEAFNWMHRLELTARSQLAAMATGAKLRPVPQDVLHETYMNYQPQTRRPYGVMEWPALLRKLDRQDPSYKE